MEHGEEIHSIKDSLQRILFYLENDGKTGRKGLVMDVEDLKEDVESVKKNLNDFINEYRQAQAVKAAKASVWGIVGGSVVSFVIWLLKHIFA